MAQLLECPTDALVDLHEVRVPPQDLEPSFDYVWVVQKRDDIPSGSRGRLILTDVEFCNNRPALDTETVRKLRMIVMPTARDTLLRSLGLRPYCQHGPCLMRCNGHFIPQMAPFSMNHGDYLHIVIGPLSEQQCIDTRMAVAACHHGFTNLEVVAMSREVPEGVSTHHVPNSETYLDHLPHDENGHIELVQHNATLIRTCNAPHPRTCHNDGELQETLTNLREIQNQRGRDAENDIMEALNVERPVIRDLHGFWLRLAEPWLNNRRWLEVQVWYISHARWRICVTSRPVWLGEDFTLWYDTILQAWADEIDDLDSVTLLIVSPQPEDDEGQVTCHLILVQHDVLPEEEGAALVCLSDDDYHRGRLECQAMVLPLRITHELLLTVANRISQCLRVPSMARCTTSFGLFDLTHEPMRGRPGFCYHVKIRHRSYNPMSVSFPVTVPANSPAICSCLARCHPPTTRSSSTRSCESAHCLMVS